MRGHRPFTYVILAINALFVIWLIAGVGGAASYVPDWCYMAGMAKHWAECEAGNALIAARIAVARDIIFFSGFVDIILGFVWLVTNGRYKAKKAAEATPAIASAQ
jgi:hypothetical protein